MIKGILFDMDGVLTDSESFICNAAIKMFEEFGYHVSAEDFKPFTGMGENKYLGGVAEKYGIPVDIEKIKSRTYSIYSEIVRGKLMPLPGAVSFVKKCRENGFRLALATSADRVKMEINLREIGLDRKLFNSIVTGLDVENKKPAPDIYIKASENIGLDPSECMVVEDAVSGIIAGKNAGCRCLAVTTSFSMEELLKAGADWVFDSLNDVPLKEFE